MRFLDPKNNIYCIEFVVDCNSELESFYLKNTSYANRIKVATTTTRKNIRIKLFPLLIANFAPSQPPKELLAAIGSAIAQIIFPFKMNKHIEPKLVERFTILAFAEACKKSNPIMAIKATTRKLPVPGPMKPSYKPTTKLIATAFKICVLAECTFSIC